jgi:Fe-S oxidoreductase/nitrate reductase gamma subunit
MESSMEFTREIYWNVGHGAATLVPMYLLVIAAVAIVVKALLHRREVYRQGLPLDRTDNIGARIGTMLTDILLQRRVTRVKLPGMFHGLFFWGFFLLLIGTTLIVVQADFTDLLFGYRFLTGTFYQAFSITLDFAGLVALIMLLALFVRRYIIRPAELQTKVDDAIMHGLMTAILVTGFVIEGSRMAVTELGTPLAAWSPVGNLVAQLMAGLGEEGLRVIHRMTWWFHLLLVTGFITLIPFTKFRHIFTASANYFFADRGPKGQLRSIDLENEEAETFGANSIKQMTWKDIFDADACTLCNRCQDRCPAWSTGKPLSPLKVVNHIGEAAFTAPDTNLIETIGRDALWSCTTCRACQDICPAAIEHVGKIIDLRRSMVLMEADFPPELMETFNNLENQGNPWGFSYDSRADWTKDLNVPLMADTPDADILWFVGCAGSFSDRGIVTSKAIASLLNKAGVSFAILGPEERCNGDMARRAGNEYLAQMMIAQNVETLNQYKPKRILTGCPHCFNTIKNEYPEFGAAYEVVSHVDFIAELIADGKLKVTGDIAKRITYHDSCYLGRWNNIYQSPRRLLSAINSGGEQLEMSRNLDNAMCCGAGGGRMFMEETIGERINSVRANDAIATGAELVSTACPFCLTMFSDGLRDNGSSCRAMDIAELVNEAT